VAGGPRSCLRSRSRGLLELSEQVTRSRGSGYMTIPFKPRWWHRSNKTDKQTNPTRENANVLPIRRVGRRGRMASEYRANACVCPSAQEKPTGVFSISTGEYSRRVYITLGARPPPTVRPRASAQEGAGMRPQPSAPPSIQNNSDLSQGPARHSGAGWHKVGGELEMRRGGRRAHCGIPIQNGSPRCLPSHLVTVPSNQ
jgi:hypothetical protein